MEEIVEEINIFDLKKRPTIKQLYLEASDKEVNLDYFLYTCHEEESTYHVLPPLHRKQIESRRYPVVLHALRGEQSLAESEQAKDLAQLIQELCRWYVSSEPQLAGRELLNYELHSELLGPLVLMILDIKSLVEFKTGQKLPAWESDASEPSPVWTLLQEQLIQHFPAYGEKMLAYLQWSCKKAKPQNYDLATLPPVGRFVPILQSFQRRQEAAKYQPRPSSSEARDARKTSEGPAPRMEHGRPDRGRPDRGRPDRGQSSGRRGPEVQVYAKPSKGREQAPERDREKEAMQDAERGITTLKKSKILKEVLLKPQNSFIRRKQHKKIVASGLFSESVGEGPNRAVKILRKPSKHKK